MKLKNVRIGEQYIIKSLEHSYVGDHRKVGNICTVDGFCHSMVNTVTCRDDNGATWGIHHKDIKPLPIQYTHPMQEHLGKEVITTLGRGFVVSTGIPLDDLYLLVDCGDGCDGNNGQKYAAHPYITKTCKWVHSNECKFLTEDDE